MDFLDYLMPPEKRDRDKEQYLTRVRQALLRGEDAPPDRSLVGTISGLSMPNLPEGFYPSGLPRYAGNDKPPQVDVAIPDVSDPYRASQNYGEGMPAQAPGRPQALPQAMGRTQGPPGGQNAPVGPSRPPGGAATGQPTPATDPYGIDKLEREREAAMKAQDALMEPLDRSGMEETYKRRAATGGRHMALALLANEAKLEPFSAHHLKQAAEARAPMKMAGGTMTEEGFIADPAYEQEMKLRRADGRVKQIEQALQGALTRQDRAALEREKIKAQMDMKREQIEAQKTIAAIVHGGKAGEGGGFDALPKAATNEEKKAYAAAVAGRTAIPQLMAEVDANPKAFGMGVGLGEKAGGMVGAGNPVPMTAQEQATRARIFSRYSAIINEMIGAAQSPAEYARLQAFIPGQLESAEGIKRKMEGALQEFNATHGLLRQRYQMGEGPVYTEPGKGPPPPRIGEVVDGYTYRGGDPANPRSWSK